MMYLRLEDTATVTETVVHRIEYAGQSEEWLEWSVDLAAVKKITIGLGDGSDSGQVDLDEDVIYIDDIRLCPLRCFNVGQLDLRGDANGDCVMRGAGRGIRSAL